MATNKLTAKEVAAIMTTARHIVQRPRGFYPMPLSRADLVAVHNAQFPDDVVKASQTLCASGHILANQICFMWLDMRVVGVGRETLRVRVGGTEPVYLSSRKPPFSSTGAACRTALGHIDQILGMDKTRALVDWGRAVRQAQEEGAKAIVVLEKLLEIPSTIGQLARMVPDLMPLVSSEKQAVALEQQKASALPSEWAATPREPVNAMLDHLTRCNLMPKVEYRLGDNGNVLGFTEYGGSPWPTWE